MLRKHIVIGALGLALVASVLTGSPAQAKSPKLLIQAGAVHPRNKDAPYEYMRFYPDVIKVHQGQMVRWKILGFHTVTFSKKGRDPFLRPDEVPGTYAFAEAQAFGTECGRAGKTCVVNKSTKFESSASPLFTDEPVDYRIDLPPGRYRYFCEIHSQMYGTVQVVPNSSPIPTQKQVNAQIAKYVAKDSAAMDAIYKADQIPHSKVSSDGVREWRVKLGDQTRDNHVETIAYLPNDLKVAAGDRVKYEFPSYGHNDLHTVTFPQQLTGGFSQLPVPYGLAGMSFNPSCDFDGRTSGLPGIIGPPWGAVIPCPADLEFVLAPWLTDAHPSPGNVVLTPATYHDSGLLFPPHEPRIFRVRPDGHEFPSSFVANFPAAGTFDFECDVHAEAMQGSVTVS